MAGRCSFPEASLVHCIVLFSIHKNGNVIKAITLWLRIIFNNISWHVKAGLLSFASSRFIVWAFMSCALERGPNPGCHTQNHMVHLFLTEDVVGLCISEPSSHPNVNTLTFSRRKGKHGTRALSGKGVSCSHSRGDRTGQSLSHQDDP